MSGRATDAIRADRDLAQSRRLLEELDGAPRLGGARNVYVAVLMQLSSAGLSMRGASGAVVSTLQVRLAGVESVLPAASEVLTSKVCCPSDRPA